MKPLCFLKIGPRVHQEIYILVIEAEKIKISEIFWGKFLPDKNFPPLHPLYNKSNSLLSSLLSWVGVGGAGARAGGRGRGCGGGGGGGGGRGGGGWAIKEQPRKFE